MYLPILCGRFIHLLRREDAPKPGDVMPTFVLPDETGRLVSLKDLLAQGPAVVTFHRGHWCPSLVDEPAED
jgi:peroxiredoxin